MISTVANNTIGVQHLSDRYLRKHTYISTKPDKYNCSHAPVLSQHLGMLNV